MFKSFKEWILFLLLKLHDFFVKPNFTVENNEKWLLVVKLDLLGDYVLIRNFMEQLKNSDNYRGYRLAFCCNAAVFELSKSLDAHFIDEWIPIKLKPFIKDFKYRRQTIKMLRSIKYEVAIFPTQSRSFFYDDMIANSVKASTKIAAKGNTYNQLPWQSKLSQNWYTHLINKPVLFDFEFNLNRHFFAEMLPNMVLPNFPSIQVTTSSKNNKILVSPGASAEFRRWSIANFVELIDFILEKNKDLEIVLSGAPSEKFLCDEIKLKFKAEQRVKNLCGKLKLSDLVNELATCTLVISNESGVTHLAKAIGVNLVYCISNGNHYKRFNPYPKDDSGVRMRYFYPNELEIEIEKDEKLAIEKYYWGSSINIESVKVETLKDAIKKDYLSFFTN